MSDIKQKVITALKNKNKNISEGTVITYVSVLKSLMKRMGVTDINKLAEPTNVIPEINKMISP